MFEQQVALYSTAFWGILIAIITVVVQANIAGVSKAKQPGAIPGKIDESLSHESFIFRAHRTFHNSLETFPTFIAAALLAIFVGADAFWVAIFIHSYAISRIMHMALYYAIATEKNPSPRTLFFMFGFLSTLALLVLTAVTLATI